MKRDELRKHLGSWRVPVRGDVRREHQASIEDAIAVAPAPARVPVRRVSRRVAWVAAALVGALIPTGIALAAEGALPGDVLYPVKRVTEDVRSWWDSDIAAQHRIEELEALLRRGVGLDRLVAEIAAAERVVARLRSDHPLHHRLDAILHHESDAAPGSSEEPDDSASPGDRPSRVDRTTTTTSPPHRATTTTAGPADAPDTRVDGEPEGSQPGDGAVLTLEELQLLSRIRDADLALDGLPGEIAALVEALRTGVDLTAAEAHTLLVFFAAHPGLLEPQPVESTTTTTSASDRPAESDSPGGVTTTTTGTNTTVPEDRSDRPNDGAATSTIPSDH